MNGLLKNVTPVQVAAALVVLYAGYRVVKFGESIPAAVGTAVNPASPDNIFYSGVNAIGRAVTGSEHWTLGGALYDAREG